eukprot:2694958-Rhodomonas_salina.2
MLTKRMVLSVEWWAEEHVAELQWCYLPAPRNQIQENTNSVQIVPGMRFLVCSVRDCYAMSGTDIAYGATRRDLKAMARAR